MQSMVRRTIIIMALFVIGISIGYFLFFDKEDWREREHPPPSYLSALEKFSQGDIAEGLDILKGLRRRFRSPIWEKRWHFLSGYWSLESEQAGRALKHFQKSYTQEDSLHFLSLYYGALSAMKAGKARTAVELSTILLQKSHSHPFLAESIYLLSDALIQCGEFERARAVLFEHKNRLAKNSRSAFLFKLASIDVKEGKKEKATSRFKKIYCLYPLSPESSQLEREITLDKSAGVWTRSDIPLLLQRGKILEDQRKFSEALHYYKSLPILFPEYATDPEFQLRLGRTYYGMREIDEALDHLKRLKGTGEPTAEAKYFLAKISLHQGRSRTFKREMEILASAKESTDIKARSLMSLGEYYDNRGKWSSALPYFEMYARQYPFGKKAGKALWRTALIHYLQRDYRQSLSHLNKILKTKDNPYREPATFWAAKCQEQLRNKQEALKLYRSLMKTSPFEYYGIEAEERSQKLSRQQKKMRFTTEINSQNAPWIPAALSQDFIASQELILLDLKEIALQVLEKACLRQSQRRIDPFLKAAEIALELNEAERAEVLVQRGLSRSQPPLTEIPIPFLKLIYPKKETLNICQTAERFSLDCRLVHAIILQESAFNASAVSRSGAIGLMQIMPDTGRVIARRMREDEHSDSRLFNPQYNLFLGCQHFSRILGQFKGSLELSLAAYNAGETNAKKWKKWFTGHDIEEYVDNIPYFETRNYIKKIKSHYKIYSELYGS
jgi:soluble lytic murein transglycosylase